MTLNWKPTQSHSCAAGYKLRKSSSEDSNVVARVPGYRSRGPGSILGAIRFTEK
jgi:hypothetical protein